MNERPFSRGGFVSDETRPATSAGIRPGTQQNDESLSRPTTSGRPVTSRPVSSALRGAPSTASRLVSTAAMQRPTTKAGVAAGIGFSTPISVLDRPITQQGLSGIKTGSRGPQRQVQDKSYYINVLRSKAADITTEVNRLNQEINTMKQEQSTFLTYDKRVKEIAQELTELQGTLADYNLLIDLLNTDTERMEVDEERKELQNINEEKMTKLDSLFNKKQEIEKLMRQKEMDLEEERRMGDSMIEAMQPNLRHKYHDLINMHNVYLQKLDQMQQDMDTLDARKQLLQDEIALSKVKQEAVELHVKLQEAEEKKSSIIKENQQRGTPAEERERLLEQVKDDNGEIATMERQIVEVQEDIARLQEDLHETEMELEENQSERSQKYRELRKKEEAMDQFLKTFESNKEEEKKRLETLEDNNVVELENISRNLTHFGQLPSSREFGSMRSDLQFKEGELEKSQYTEQNLKAEQLNLQANLQKIETLEVKVQKEKVEIEQNLDRMNKELIEFTDIEGLKSKMEEKRMNLSKTKTEFEDRKAALDQTLKDTAIDIAFIKKQLTDNDTHNQLQNLEKKWAHIEQANFTLKEFIAQKRAESNFIPLKNQAIKLVTDYNKLLQEVLHSGGTIA